MLISRVPVGRNPVVGWQLQAYRKKTLLRRIALQYRRLGTGRDKGGSIFPLNILLVQQDVFMLSEHGRPRQQYGDDREGDNPVALCSHHVLLWLATL